MSTRDLTSIQSDLRTIAEALVSEEYQSAIDSTASLLQYVGGLIAQATDTRATYKQIGYLSALTGANIPDDALDKRTASQAIQELLGFGETVNCRSIFVEYGRMRLENGATTLYPIAWTVDFDGEVEANARLIAAAPKLLDALIDAAAAEWPDDDTMQLMAPNLYDTIMCARVLLAECEGE